MNTPVRPTPALKKNSIKCYSNCSFDAEGNEKYLLNKKQITISRKDEPGYTSSLSHPKAHPELKQVDVDMDPSIFIMISLNNEKIGQFNYEEKHFVSSKAQVIIRAKCFQIPGNMELDDLESFAKNLFFVNFFAG